MFYPFFIHLDKFQAIIKNVEKSGFKPLRSRRGGGYPNLSGSTTKKIILLSIYYSSKQFEQVFSIY